MSRLRTGPVPARWVRLPRRSARLRLTVLYAGLFLVSGAAVLAITYLLVEHWRLPLYQGPTRISIPPAGNPAAHLLQQQRLADLHQLLQALAVALAVVAVVSIASGWIVAGRVLRPLRTITATARRISARNLNERLDLKGADDELRQLGDTLDDLFARLQASFDAQRQFVANASHELRTPLTAERTLLQVALASPKTSAERWRSTGHELLASSDEQARLIEALLTLANSEAGPDHYEPVDLAAITRRAILAPRPGIGRLGLHVETSIRPALVEGDPLLLERLVANLIDNAVRYNQVAGGVAVSTGTSGGRALLSVGNTGPVIPTGEVDRLLEPFQRLDGRRTHQGDGHGLGLSIVRAIASTHGASLRVHPRESGGLDIEVCFRSLTPEALRGKPSPLHEGGELGPGDLGVGHPRAEAAVRPRDHVLTADDLGEAHEPLGNELRMLDMQ